jgi:uncharacterized membrane protein YkvA (DUF1232 family)
MLRLFRIWRVARYDVGLLWFALRHPNRPAWIVPAACALLFCALEPLNFAVPVLGVVDDFILLPLLLHWLTKLLPAQIPIDFNRRRGVSP